MNRLIATLIVFAMALLAVAISVWQTWKLQDDLGNSATWLFGLEAVIAGSLIATGGMLLKRGIEARVRKANRGRLAIVEPLRRLFSVVWS
ncbi:MAG TPA: hypothetical protein VFZ23_02165 [Pyrinomonadaceae bacterium]